MTVIKSKYVQEASAVEFLNNLMNKGKLGRLSFELTRRCNFNCRHCYTNQPAGSREERTQELSTSKILSLLEEAEAIGCQTIQMTGGEPLLRQDFATIYKRTRQLGMNVSLSTNAALITKELADLFAQYPPGDGILVSIYGLSDEEYEKTTGQKGGLDKVKRGLKLLKERNIQVSIRANLLDPQPGLEQEFQAFVREFTHDEETPVNWPMKLSLRQYHDSDEANDRIKNLRFSGKEWVQRAIQENPDYFFVEMGAALCRLSGISGNKPFVCQAGIKLGAVSYDGMYKPCMVFGKSDFDIDLREHTLAEAVAMTRERMLTLTSQHPNFEKQCARCFLRANCKSCPGRSDAEHGKFDQPVDYFCELAHEEARYFNLLGPDEKAWEIADWRTRIEALRNRLVEKGVDYRSTIPRGEKGDE